MNQISDAWLVAQAIFIHEVYQRFPEAGWTVKGWGEVSTWSAGCPPIVLLVVKACCLVSFLGKNC